MGSTTETTVVLDPSTVDVAFLEKKYAEERDKRARKIGIESYIQVEGVFQHYEEDPYTPQVERAPMEFESSILIIGGGFGGLQLAARLIDRGVTDIRIVERAGGFGGTWYWNRYPGAQCDVESYIYMPLLEETGYIPTAKYIGWQELLDYSNLLGKRWNLHDKALFHTGVKEMTWDDDRSVWIVKTDRGDTLRCRHVISATGSMHKPKLPGIEGIHDFKNHSFHTSRWDYEYTGGADGGPLDKLKDKRVGLIGTGATAIQCVPELGKTAKELYIFQRTPSSVDVRNNRKTDVEWFKALASVPGWQARRRNNFWTLTTGGTAPTDEVSDAWTSLRFFMPKGSTFDGQGEVDMEAMMQNQLGDYLKMNSLRDRVDSVVKNKETAELLKPWYNRMCKRPCFHDEYLDTFNKPNVHLVDTCASPIQRITDKGVVVDGKEFELDCIIYGTGFEFFTTLERRTGMTVKGRSGQTLSQKFKDGVATLHGITTRDFPNFYIIHTSQAAAGINYVHCLDVVTTHIAHILKVCHDRNILALEPTAEAELDWTEKVVADQVASAAFLQTCTPGYYNHEGKLTPTAQKSQHMELFRYVGFLNEFKKGSLPGMEVRTSAE